MTQAYFNNLADQLCFQLSKAKNNISAAVCWFSHANIFDVLKKKFWTGENVYAKLPAVQLRDLRLFTCRMKPGDIVLMAGKKKQLQAIGIIQSEPKRYESALYASARDVQWWKIVPVITPVYLEKKGYLPAVGRFRGSGLRLLQEIFEKAELVWKVWVLLKTAME